MIFINSYPFLTLQNSFLAIAITISSFFYIKKHYATNQEINTHENLENFVLSGTAILAIAQSYFENDSPPAEMKNVRLTSKDFNQALNMFRKELTLKRSVITTENAETLNKYSSKLTSLESFILKRTDNSQAQVILLAEVLQKWPTMKNLRLNLSSNDIGFNEIITLAEVLKKLTHLETLELDLSYNRIDADRAIVLAALFQELTHLTSLSLDLGGNEIKANGIKALASAFKQLKHLEVLELDLWNNAIDATEQGALAAALTSLTGLKKLSINLSDNNMGTHGIEDLVIALRELTNLESLSLKIRSNDTRSERVIIALEQTLKKLHNHHLMDLELDLSCNPINDSGARLLTDRLSTLTKLKTLKLNLKDTQLHIIAASDLIKKITTLNNLTSLWLDLQRNNIGAELEGTEDFNTALKALKTLPKNLESLHLWLDENPIDDASLEALSLGVSTLTSLTDLRVGMFDTRVGDNGAMALLRGLKNLSKLTTTCEFRLEKRSESGISGFTDEGYKAFIKEALEILPEPLLEEIRKLSPELQD